MVPGSERVVVEVIVSAARTTFWRDAGGAGTLDEWRSPVLTTGVCT